MRYPANVAQAIKYEKREGKSSLKEDIQTSVIVLSVTVVPVIAHALPSKQKNRIWYTCSVTVGFSRSGLPEE
jgi:hypothetical protein